MGIFPSVDWDSACPFEKVTTTNEIEHFDTHTLLLPAAGLSEPQFLTRLSLWLHGGDIPTPQLTRPSFHPSAWFSIFKVHSKFELSTFVHISDIIAQYDDNVVGVTDPASRQARFLRFVYYLTVYSNKIAYFGPKDLMFLDPDAESPFSSTISTATATTTTTEASTTSKAEGLFPKYVLVHHPQILGAPLTHDRDATTPCHIQLLAWYNPNLLAKFDPQHFHIVPHQLALLRNSPTLFSHSPLLRINQMDVHRVGESIALRRKQIPFYLLNLDVASPQAIHTLTSFLLFLQQFAAAGSMLYHPHTPVLILLENSTQLDSEHYLPLETILDLFQTHAPLSPLPKFVHTTAHTNAHARMDAFTAITPHPTHSCAEYAPILEQSRPLTPSRYDTATNDDDQAKEINQQLAAFLHDALINLIKDAFVTPSNNAFVTSSTKSTAQSTPAPSTSIETTLAALREVNTTALATVGHLNNSPPCYFIGSFDYSPVEIPARMRYLCRALLAHSTTPLPPAHYPSLLPLLTSPHLQHFYTMRMRNQWSNLDTLGVKLLTLATYSFVLANTDAVESDLAAIASHGTHRRVSRTVHHLAKQLTQGGTKHKNASKAGQHVTYALDHLVSIAPPAASTYQSPSMPSQLEHQQSSAWTITPTSSAGRPSSKFTFAAEPVDQTTQECLNAITNLKVHLPSPSLSLSLPNRGDPTPPDLGPRTPPLPLPRTILSLSQTIAQLPTTSTLMSSPSFGIPRPNTS